MPALLRPEHVALIEGGVSAIAASRGTAGFPSLVRAVGTAIDTAGTRVTLLLRPDQSRQLLADLAAGGPIAVVFSQPSTNRTLQLKAEGATQRPATPAESASHAAYVQAMQREIGSLGYDPAFVAAMLHAQPLQDLVAVEFRPQQAFEQTPGPQAGTPLSTVEPP